jgi:hypothetical protein
MSFGFICGQITKSLGSSGSITPERVKYIIGDRKMMAPIVWNPQCFPLVDTLPKGQNLNASYDLDIIL